MLVVTKLDRQGRGAAAVVMKVKALTSTRTEVVMLQLGKVDLVSTS